MIAQIGLGWRLAISFGWQPGNLATRQLGNSATGNSSPNC
jgi:hypothetical protein